MAEFTDHYYLGQWEWNQPEKGFSSWRSPHSDKVTGCIDLRSMSQQSIPGGVPQGYAIFAYLETINDPTMTYLGDSNSLSIDDNALVELQNKLGTKNPIIATSPHDLIYELLTVHADPKGETANGPLMPDSDLNMRVHLGRNGKIKESKLIPQVSPEWPIVLTAIHEGYKKLIVNDPDNMSPKVLDFWEKQYKIDYKTFIPEGYPIIDSVPHETTITESFDKADSSTLGPDLSWTELQNDFTIVSNKANYVTNNTAGYARADSALSSDNHYAQVVINFSGAFSYPGVMGRKDSSSTLTFYWALIHPDTNYNYGKTVAGVGTNFGSTRAADSAGTHTLKIEMNGSLINAYMDSVAVDGGTTDPTPITGNLYTGIAQFYWLVGSTATWDNFIASDLGAAAATTYYNAPMMLMGMGS